MYATNEFQRRRSSGDSFISKVLSGEHIVLRVTCVTLPQLNNLVRVRQLKAEPAAQAEEIDGLIRSGTARLNDAKTETLSLDGRFDLACNAAHAFSLAALRWHGYRSGEPIIRN